MKCLNKYSKTNDLNEGKLKKEYQIDDLVGETIDCVPYALP